LMNLSLQCVEALRAVHAVSYLHGDVHAGNFLTKEDHVCLIDFCLSRPIKIKNNEESKYSEGGITFYMPPEYVRQVFERKEGL